MGYVIIRITDIHLHICKTET